MSHEPVTQVKVGLCFGEGADPVGRLAIRDHRIYFEYDPAFLESGIEISPIRCPLQPGVQSFDPHLFGGLPGVFNDSLPDSWGRLLLDRKMRSLGVAPGQLSPLDRLAHVGSVGMGSLVYEPDRTERPPGKAASISMLAEHAERILQGEASDVLPELLTGNGSSGGARPKVTLGVHANRRDVMHGARQLPEGYQPWLVKFPHTYFDSADAGAIEYVYALMATAVGIDMPDAHLFPAPDGPGHFAVRRFDTDGRRRLHMHTACGLLHSDFMTPSLDYEDLTALTMTLTKDMREVEKMYRLAAFNVLAHNRDDHSKNFSFLMDKNGEWRLSPAYDVTFSPGPRGMQSSTVMGHDNPSAADLIKLGMEAKLPRQTADDIIEQTRTALAKWKPLATEHGVSKANVKMIASKLP